jgi:hypothetical protein
MEIISNWNVQFKRFQFYPYLTVWSSVAGTAIWLRAGRSGVRILIGQEMFFSPKRPYPALGHTLTRIYSGARESS